MLTKTGTIPISSDTPSKQMEKELSIVIDHERPFYLSGDQVGGHVHYQCPNTRIVRRVEVQFWGRLKSTIVEKHPLATIYTTYRDRVWLFEESQDLIPGEIATIEPGLETWPFSFTIPTTVTPWRVETWDVGPTLERFPEQSLPPSFHLNAKVKGLISGHYSIISYALTAKLYFADSGPSVPDAQAALNIIPVSPTPPPSTEHEHLSTHEARGFDLLPEDARPPQSRTNSHNSHNGNNDLALAFTKKPTLRLRLCVSHPIFLRPTQPWRAYVKLATEPPRPFDVPVPMPPAFVLRSVGARLKAKTAVAITRTAEHRRSHGNTVCEVQLKDGLGAVVPGEEKEVDLGKLKYVPATVDLSSLHRRYVMYVHAVVETVGGGHSFEVKGKAPVVVEPLPEEARGEGEVAETVRAGIAEAVLEDVGGVMDVGLGILGLVMA